MSALENQDGGLICDDVTKSPMSADRRWRRVEIAVFMYHFKKVIPPIATNVTVA